MHRHAHCDVLVVGGGPAGLMAAAGRRPSGARVILADEQPELGGSLLPTRPSDDRRRCAALRWVGSGRRALAACPR